jgi:hypothetical protein
MLLIFIIGIIIGATFGIIIAGLCAAAKISDLEIELFNKKDGEE